MRKLKLQMQLSLDGYCAGPNQEMDWMIWDFDQQLKKHLNELAAPVDCILLGRKLAEGFIPTWKERLADPAGEDPVFVKKMNDTHKVIFSNTLTKSVWENTTLATKDLKTEINNLKQQDGGDIIMYGGHNFASNVISENLIDEYNLYIHPIAIGNGLAPFHNRTSLELVQSKTFACGITFIQYKSKAV